MNNPDPEDFESLRRLLSLKRHEQPPPRYFNDFSSHVIERIRAGEHREDSAAETLSQEAPWLLRLWAALEGKPVFAGLFGTAVCALLIFGIVQSEEAGMAPVSAQLAGDSNPFVKVVPANSSTLGQPQFISSSTNPVPTRSLFDQIGLPQVEPVSFPGSGN